MSLRADGDIGCGVRWPGNRAAHWTVRFYGLRRRNGRYDVRSERLRDSAKNVAVAQRLWPKLLEFCRTDHISQKLPAQESHKIQGNCQTSLSWGRRRLEHTVIPPLSTHSLGACKVASFPKMKYMKVKSILNSWPQSQKILGIVKQSRRIWLANPSVREVKVEGWRRHMLKSELLSFGINMSEAWAVTRKPRNNTPLNYTDTV
jgi:hypothetical protein